MNNAAEIDLLIVGQGLAGSAVALRALARKYRIAVIDNPADNHSSAVAAGLFNPITGRKMVKTWLADEIFPALHQFYGEAEQLTGHRFFYPMPIYRPFLTPEEQNEWMGKSADPGLRDYIGKVSVTPMFGSQVSDPFGGITLRQCGYLDTRAYLQAVREYVGKNAVLTESDFRADRLQIEEDCVRYEGLLARKIIFCQGVANPSNPWFGSLPVNSLKGEFITVQCDWKNGVMLNRGVYMAPGNAPGEWRVGATYNWNDSSPACSEGARAELSGKLEDLIRFGYSITGQQWGFRPTTPDRKPILGSHPQHKSLVIFNGLGTKGVSLAPYFSGVLFRWMENEGMINREADVTRFY